jgi:hypothetical protein
MCGLRAANKKSDQIPFVIRQYAASITCWDHEAPQKEKGKSSTCLSDPKSSLYKEGLYRSAEIKCNPTCNIVGDLNNKL